MNISGGLLGMESQKQINNLIIDIHNDHKSIMLCKSMVRQNSVMDIHNVKLKTPRSWIQISESRWEVVQESCEGFILSGILAAPWVQDSLIWIQPWGVFRINPTPGG